MSGPTKIRAVPIEKLEGGCLTPLKIPQEWSKEKCDSIGGSNFYGLWRFYVGVVWLVPNLHFNRWPMYQDRSVNSAGAGSP